jgi:1,4-alpha-glucan branching enzyme
VYGKGSLLEKMAGDDWQKFANLRALYGYMYAQPGKKLLFMGGEFAQRREWAHDSSLDWDLLDYPAHAGVQRWVRDLNLLYRKEPAMHELDCEPSGFEWIDCDDKDSSVVSLLRKGRSTSTLIIAVCNFTPVPRQGYRIGAPRGGYWREVLNSDAAAYGGSGMGNGGGIEAESAPVHGRPCSLNLTLPPLSVLFFTNQT